MKSKVRWVPAKATLGQNQFITEHLRAPAEPLPTVPVAPIAPAVAPVATASAPAPEADGKALINGLFYGGVILAGLTLAWALTRKS